ncbi:stalk domain-containing protein [Pelotomaculum propionicicum]|uniref:stalk domain-containing protein n=1 Tax=Pelotomaculum propionicicum TaxID=258475 RepID=UPI003B797AB5
MKRIIKIILCIIILITTTLYFLKKESAAVIYANINIELIESKANAAVISANFMLKRMNIAYQAWAVPKQSYLMINAVNAKSSGVKGDGITDDTVSIQKAINSLPPGAVLYFPAGNYKLNGQINISRSITLSGEPGTVFDCSAVPSDVFTVNTGGYADSTTAIDGDIYPGSSSVTVGDASNFSVDTYIKIYDDQSINGFKKGEICKIKSINGNTINLETPVNYTYRAAAGGMIRKLKIIDDVAVNSIEFIGPGEETEPYLIHAFLIRNFSFTGCKVGNFGRAAIGMTDCIDSAVNGNLFENIFMTGFGYSVEITNSCDNIKINDNYFIKKGRHYIAAGGQTGTNLNGGFPKKIVIKNNFFEDSADEAINTHSPFSGPVTVSENIFNRCEKGIEITNGKSSIINNKFINCVNAVEYYEDNDIYPGFHSAQENVFINNNLALKSFAPRLAFTDNIMINSGMVINQISYAHIEGNYIADLPKKRNPIEITGGDNYEVQSVIIQNNVIKDCASTNAIKTDNIKNIIIKNNIIKNSGSILSALSSRATISGNYSLGSNDYGIQIEDAAENYVINNTVKNAKIRPLVIETSPKHDSLVAVNTNQFFGVILSEIKNNKNVVLKTNEDIVLSLASRLTENSPNIIVNEKYLSFDTPPVTQNGHLLVPVRAVCDELGANLNWDGLYQLISLDIEDITVTLKIGSSAAYLNGKEVIIDVPAQLIDNRTFVPLRFISEALGAQVRWDETTQTAYISTQN